MNVIHEELVEQFNQPGLIAIKKGRGGLPCVQITTPHALAVVYLHGAHLTHYQLLGGSPLLYMSEQSQFETGKAIRGGVPICFPWFGAGPQGNQTPMHGFARLLPWTLMSADETSQGNVELLLSLTNNEQTRKYWPHEFSLGMRITVGQTLTMSLEMRNTGNDDYFFEEALHTYFAIGDIRKTSVSGLDNASYLNKVQQGVFKHGQGPVTFQGETDRVYDSTTDCDISDLAMGRKISVKKTNSRSTVVWNPWIEKAAAMPDFGNDDWINMLCVETANVQKNAVALPPGGRHTMTVTLDVAPE